MSKPSIVVCRIIDKYEWNSKIMGSDKLVRILTSWLIYHYSNNIENVKVGTFWKGSCYCEFYQVPALYYQASDHQVDDDLMPDDQKWGYSVKHRVKAAFSEGLHFGILLCSVYEIKHFQFQR